MYYSLVLDTPDQIPSTLILYYVGLVHSSRLSGAVKSLLLLE